MPVQDDERERELVRVFNLDWNPDHQRAGVDATLSASCTLGKFRVEVEVKSTTGSSVSTARDVGMAHIEKWRRKFFVIGFYTHDRNRPELKKCMCLTPIDMEPWIASIEAKILPDHRIAELAARRLELQDLYTICGKGDTYSIESARNLHKQQWSAEQYRQACDVEVNGSPRISDHKMLEILQLRAKYIAERGATLNNPHITGQHLNAFAGTNREILSSSWASAIREIAASFAERYPTHKALEFFD